MKRISLGIFCMGLLVLASCSSVIFPPDSKKEAKDRWSQMRGKLKYQLAVETFTGGQLDEAQKHLNESIGLDPTAAAPYVLRAKILLERGETGSASDALDEALRHGGDTAETDYLSGLIAQRYGRFGDALAWYEHASTREPMNAPYVVAVAETLVALDRAADALARVRSRLTDFEQNATLRALAGGIYMMLDRYEEAADAYRDAARIVPDDQRLQYQLGLALTLSENYQEGAAVLAAAVKAEDPAAPVEASALSALARCRLAMNQPEEAKAAMRRVVEADPNSPRNWALLARAALAANDLLSARQAATRAAQMAPGEADPAILLAYICCEQRDFPTAIGILQGVLRAAPDDSMALYLLAQSHTALGNAAAAQECARRALRADPQAEWAGHMLGRPDPQMNADGRR